jgi:hypothetical protein
VRVIFRRVGEEPIEYPLMELSPTRIGAAEAEFVCRGHNLFFDISVVLPLPLVGSTRPTITFHHRTYLRQDVGQVKKYLDALTSLRTGGEMQIFDLATEKNFATIGGANLGDESAAEIRFREVVTDLARIAERFRLELRLSAEFSDEDLASILLLRALIEGGSLPVENISAVVVKSEENRNLFPQMLTETGGFLRLEHPRCEPMPRLLGHTVDTGPYALEAEVQVNDLGSMLHRFKAATIGGEIPVSCRPVAPVRFFLLSPQELKHPRSFLFRKKD